MARAMVSREQPVGGPGAALYSRTQRPPPGDGVVAERALQGGGWQVGGNPDQMAANRAETRLRLVGWGLDASLMRGASYMGCSWVYQVHLSPQAGDSEDD